MGRMFLREFVHAERLPLIRHASRDSFPPKGEASGTESLPLAGEGAPDRGRMRSKLRRLHGANLWERYFFCRKSRTISTK